MNETKTESASSVTKEVPEEDELKLRILKMAKDAGISLLGEEITHLGYRVKTLEIALQRKNEQLEEALDQRDIDHKERLAIEDRVKTARQFLSEWEHQRDEGKTWRVAMMAMRRMRAALGDGKKRYKARYQREP